MAPILVVDDEAQILRALKIGLEQHGHRVVTAASGEEGLEMAVDQAPELMVLDLGLPDVQGVEVIKRLRAWSAVPVIVLSGREGQSDKVQALEAGADDYVTKPFGLQELLARIGAVLRRAPPQTEGRT